MYPVPPSTLASASRESLRGFTLVEVLVAVLLLSAGVSALEYTSLLMERSLAAANARDLSARLATTRLEQAAARACAGVLSSRSGAGVTQGINEIWSSSPVGDALIVTDSLTLPGRITVQRQGLSGLTGC